MVKLANDKRALISSPNRTTFHQTLAEAREMTVVCYSAISNQTTINQFYRSLSIEDPASEWRAVNSSFNMTL
jgi:hypothetical protein